MPERQITVFIYLPNETIAVPAGIFTHNPDSGIGSFAYGRRYLERKNALPVDPAALPLGMHPKEIIINGGLYGAFRDASPDYWGRLIISATFNAPPEALSEMDYLMAANATRVGNLDFRTSPDAPEPELIPPHFNQLADIMDAAARVAVGEKIEDHILQILRQGTSMGGARPKSTVEYKDTLWIAKFPTKGDYLNIPCIEYATMKLAERCGIRIPEVRIMTVGGKDVFLIRRFDRKKSGESWNRIGFISALSLMQWDESDRLRWDYPMIADTMRRYTPIDNMHELFCRMVFNILVRNTDDHPRNHGFLFDGHSMNLSPAYDLVPSPAYPDVGIDFHLAMSIGDQGRKATLKNAVSRSARFGLSEKNALDRIEQIRATVTRWREYFTEYGVATNEQDMLAPSFQKAEGVG